MLNAERNAVNNMLKKNELIKNNRQAINDFCGRINRIAKKIRYLPTAVQAEAERQLTDLNDAVRFLDPTKENVTEKIKHLSPAVIELSKELDNLIEIESDTAESLKDIVRHYT